MDAKTYAKSLVKVQGKEQALRMAEENLRYSETGWGTPPFANEVLSISGEGRKAQVVTNDKKQNRRLNRNLNFWKNVKIEVKRLVK